MDINAGIDINGGAMEDSSPDYPSWNRTSVLESINDKLYRISSQISSSGEIQSYGRLCIYKVPEKHRNQNQEAYAPQIVSIGFVHHGEPELLAMEECKLRYLKNFLERFSVTLEELVEYVNGEVNRVCSCYEEICVQKVSQSKDPREVILLDGIFIVELFLKNAFPILREKGDRVFDNSMVSNEIIHDLLLFENQLPCSFLFTLYATVRPHFKTFTLDFDELVSRYFVDVGNTRVRDFSYRYPRHFVEFLSILHTTPDRIRDAGKLDSVNLGFPTTPLYESNFRRCPTAAKLRAVGVEFKEGKSFYLDTVEFNEKTGALTIPPLTVNRFTETFFRNLIAFEQSGHHLKWATSFVMFLDTLIDTPKDVEVLIEYKIIQNELGSSQQVAHLFNTLYKEFPADTDEFYYVEQCRQLNDYSRQWRHELKAGTKTWIVAMWRRYFSTPWSLCSLIAAITVLALTAIQTAYAIKAYYRGY